MDGLTTLPPSTLSPRGVTALLRLIPWSPNTVCQPLPLRPLELLSLHAAAPRDSTWSSSYYGQEMSSRSPHHSLDINELSREGVLAKVWTPIKTGDQYMLSTCDQAYLLDPRLFQYREIMIDNEVHCSIAIPILEATGTSCCAVMELVTSKEKLSFDMEMDSVCRALQPGSTTVHESFPGSSGDSLLWLKGCKLKDVSGPSPSDVLAKIQDVQDSTGSQGASEQDISRGRTPERKKGATERNVSLRVLQQHFSGSLKDAARSIGGEIFK
ncbi:hypothetical protein Bca101_040713 [Brassica carinata]